MNKVIVNVIYLFGSIILTIYALIFVFGGMIKKTETNKEVEASYVEWNERIEDNNTWIKPTFYYKVDNKEYKCEIKYESEKSTHFKKTKIYYYDKNPNICIPEYATKPKPYIILFSLFPFMGIVYSVYNLSKSFDKKVEN